MNLLVISGSSREESNTSILSNYVEGILKTSKFNVSKVDLVNFKLPFLENEKVFENENVQMLHKLLNEADGFIVCSPEYHSGMTGALKNMFDLTDSELFEDKPTLILSVSGGGKGGVNALNSMRLTLRSLSALVLPEQCVVDDSELEDRNDLENIKNVGLKRVKDALEKFKRYV